MSLFLTGITLNCSQVSLSPSSLSLHKPPARYISSAHCCRICVFASCDSSSSSSGRSVHGVWVMCQSLWHPPTRPLYRYRSSSMRSESCFHVNVVLLAIYGRLFPLVVCSWPVELQYLLIQPRW